MTNWKDGGPYGLLCREITNETGDVICKVWTKRYESPRSIEPWPQGKENFALILQAPQTLEALNTIAEGAIVSPDQPPEKVAEQVLRVLQLVREQNCEYLLLIGAQQQRAERAEEALEAIVELKPPRWPSQGDVLGVYHRHKEIARAAIAAVKQEVNAE